ncbi:MAG TPA: mucoidy inhibitor MuiA family protein [Candidatus Omnitrophica bacterium]|nr:MAG: hypothetical protein DRP69_01235 [Candidatus Omnitrophota bacterium]RKY45062.1 MAG: hypothetical protein DRP80_00475 [Candidatus Omnitrophota bacterium]HEC69039.1 mucoidy inhibitor MuiA family protein [Candidatus Omnitrophota bacterium]
MRKLSGFILVFILGINLSFAQKIIPSKISKVTIFTNQALVTREAQAEVSPGINQLFLEISPFNLDKDSLQAKVWGEGEVFSVQYKEIPVKEMPQENIKKLEEELEKLGDKLRVLKDEKKVLQKKEDFLNSLIDFSEVEIPKELKTSFPQTSDLKSLLLFLEENLIQINKTSQDLDLKIRELEKEIEVKRRELASLRKPSQKVKKVIEILFNSFREQKINIEAGYLVYNVSWKPLYKVNVPLDLKEINFTMFAKITQNTGEDWKEVKATISNVLPLRGVTLPSLDTWWLDISRGYKYKNGLKNWGGEKAHTSLQILAFSPQREAKFAQAKRVELPLSFEYELSQVLNLPSEDRETILPLFSKTLKGEFFHYALPRVNPLTFLVCKAKPDKELLAGYLNVYLGGRFIGKTYLGEKKAGQEFKIPLGADREVKVEKKKIKDEIKETFFGKIERKTIIRKLAYKIVLENLKDKEINIKVLDNIPVSRTDKIEVKDLKINPQPKVKDYQDKKGVNLWEIKLKPEEKKEINIEFTLTYPKEVNIWGL